MKMDKYMLAVLDDLKNNTYFFVTNNFILYKIPDEKDSLSDKVCANRILAVYDLCELRAITIHNKGEERLPKTNSYEFQIIIVQPAFDGVYKRCLREVKNLTVEEHENQVDLQKNMPTIRKKLDEVIKALPLGRKQRKLLKLLESFKTVSMDELKKDIDTKDLKDLKKQVNKKLKDSPFKIEAVLKPRIHKNGEYRLIHISHPIITG